MRGLLTNSRALVGSIGNYCTLGSEFSRQERCCSLKVLSINDGGGCFPFSKDIKYILCITIILSRLSMPFFYEPHCEANVNSRLPAPLLGKQPMLYTSQYTNYILGTLCNHKEAVSPDFQVFFSFLNRTHLTQTKVGIFLEHIFRQQNLLRRSDVFASLDKNCNTATSN